jgi:Cu/Ag efflux protein CusF
MSDMIESSTVRMAEVTKGQNQDSTKAQQFSQAFANMANGQEKLIDVEIKKVELEHRKLDLEFKKLELQKAKAGSGDPARKTN